MSIGDIVVLEQASMTGRGARLFNVSAGTAVINSGEPVCFGIGGQVTVVPAPNNFPVTTSDYFVGIAATTSTQTAGTAGTVGVFPTDALMTWLIKPKVAGSWDTQAKYDALVGKSVLIDKTSGAYTLLATAPDQSTNGAVVQAISILEHPGQVAIAFKNSVSNLK